MRQIQYMIRFIAGLLLRKGTVSYVIENETSLTQTDLLYKDIMELVTRREICKAEDLLFERAEPENERYMELALDFYRTVNDFSDEELERCNFTREEIADGIKNVAKLCGVDGSLI